MENKKIEYEFDLDKVYTKTLPKKELLKIIKNSYDKEFVVSFIPRTHDNADILIRSTEEEIKKTYTTERRKK